MLFPLKLPHSNQDSLVMPTMPVSGQARGGQGTHKDSLYPDLLPASESVNVMHSQMSENEEL